MGEYCSIARLDKKKRIMVMAMIIVIVDSSKNTTYYILLLLIIIIVTVTKSYSVYIKYYSKQGEKIMVLVRILMSKSGFTTTTTNVEIQIQG
jgi:hypothetical protein